MTKRHMALAALLILSGCGFDEAKERRACDKSNPGDQPKAEECFKAAKLEYDKARQKAYQDARGIKD